jgi:cyanophycinase
MRFLVLRLLVLGFISLCVINSVADAQTVRSPNGSLFIIGGGTRSPELIQELIKTADMSPLDHIVVLPMSSAEPDTSFKYISLQLAQACKNTIANLTFDREHVNDKKMD